MDTWCSEGTQGTRTRADACAGDNVVCVRMINAVAPELRTFHVFYGRPPEIVAAILPAALVFLGEKRFRSTINQVSRETSACFTIISKVRVNLASFKRRVTYRQNNLVSKILDIPFSILYNTDIVIGLGETRINRITNELISRHLASKSARRSLTQPITLLPRSMINKPQILV